MNQFIEIIDKYIANYNQLKKCKHEFECKYGELIFFKHNTSVLTLFGIYIFPQYRKNGFCRQILQYLIDTTTNTNFKTIQVQSVLSKILYDYLLRFSYKNQGFQLKKDGFYYTRLCL